MPQYLLYMCVCVYVWRWSVLLLLAATCMCMYIKDGGGGGGADGMEKKLGWSVWSAAQLILLKDMRKCIMHAVYFILLLLQKEKRE